MKKPLKIVNLKDIGEIHFENSSKAKNINISVKPTKVRVAVPQKVSFETAYKFTLKEKEWILKNILEMKRLVKSHEGFDSNQNLSKKSAKEMLIKRLEHLSQITGLRYKRVFVKSQKTLWGSCSSKSNINLNIKLIYLPEDLQDYVMLHELVHLKHPNHSKKFWAELDRWVGNAKAFEKRLKKYRIELL